jgi:hypothetical protein
MIKLYSRSNTVYSNFLSDKFVLSHSDVKYQQAENVKGFSLLTKILAKKARLLSLVNTIIGFTEWRNEKLEWIQMHPRSSYSTKCSSSEKRANITPVIKLTGRVGSGLITEHQNKRASCSIYFWQRSTEQVSISIKSYELNILCFSIYFSIAWIIWLTYIAWAPLIA